VSAVRQRTFKRIFGVSPWGERAGGVVDEKLGKLRNELIKAQEKEKFVLGPHWDRPERTLFGELPTSRAVLRKSRAAVRALEGAQRAAKCFGL